MLRYIILALFVFTSLTSVWAQDTDDTEEQTPPQLTLSISMYLLVDDIDNPNPDVSTVRTEDGLEVILGDMNIIWGQANIELELGYVGYLEVPDVILKDIIGGDFGTFFEAIGDGSISINNVSQINGFYAKDIGGPNGITLNSQVYFVNDDPTVNDERVSSHEVGHMLGLHHELFDSSRLMYSGTNGTTLNEVEIVVARYYATGFLQGVRR